jgi:glycosyltransferase involved in cell wall biosynthesis
MLEAFVTSIYRTGRWPFNVETLPFVPPQIRQKARQVLSRRWEPQLDAHLVATAPGYHLAAYLAVHVRPSSRQLAFDAEDWANSHFDNHVANLIGHRLSPTIVHGFEGSCVLTLRQAKRTGATTILDAPSAHEQYVATESEEAARLGYARPYHPRRRTDWIKMERDLADYVLVGNTAVRKALEDEGVPGDRLVCVPYGADPGVFRPTSRDDSHRFRVLCLGLITWRKGTHYLLEAWRRLGLEDSELFIVGNPDQWGESLLRKYEGQHQHIDGVPHHEVARIMASADILVCPSLWETGPMVVLEAMAAGLPIVATSNSAGPVRHGIDGLIVPTRDSNALATAIQKLFADPELRREMGANARARIVKGYTWQHYRHRIAALYEAASQGDDPNRHLRERGLLVTDDPRPQS